MMALADFRARYPEFRTATDTYVQVVLDEASRRVSPATFGDRTNDAHGLLAAHLLVDAPYGRSQRLEAAGGAETEPGGSAMDRYIAEFNRLTLETVGPHIFVIF